MAPRLFRRATGTQNTQTSASVHRHPSSGNDQPSRKTIVSGNANLAWRSVPAAVRGWPSSASATARSGLSVRSIAWSAKPRALRPFERALRSNGERRREAAQANLAILQQSSPRRRGPQQREGARGRGSPGDRLRRRERLSHPAIELVLLREPMKQPPIPLLGRDEAKEEIEVGDPFVAPLEIVIERVTQQNEQVVGRRGDRNRPAFEVGGHRTLPHPFRVPMSGDRRGRPPMEIDAGSACTVP